MIQSVTITIIGAGDVGANIAFFAAERKLSGVIKMFDINQGLARGKSLDMLEAFPVRRSKLFIHSVESLEEALDADVVVIAAGLPRQSDNSLEALLATNRAIIDDLAPRLAASNAIVVNMAEPIDTLTALLTRKSGLPPKQVIGIGTTIDALRVRSIIAQELRLNHHNIHALVIGPHDEHMIPLPAYTRVNGVPVEQLIAPARLQELFQQAINIDAHLLDISKRSSSYYIAAAAACEVIESIVQGLGRLLPVSLMLQGEYDLEQVALGIPALIDQHGVKRTLTPRLTDSELQQLRRAAQRLEALQ